MIVTIAGARDLWCPMVRAARWESAVHNDTDPATMRVIGGCNTGGKAARSPMGARCIADECAMWRWVPSTGTHSERYVRERPGGKFEEAHRTVPSSPDRGYCGLAGRPEL